MDEQKYNYIYSEFWNQIGLFTVLQATAILVLAKESPFPTEYMDD